MSEDTKSLKAPLIREVYEDNLYDDSNSTSNFNASNTLYDNSTDNMIQEGEDDALHKLNEEMKILHKEMNFVQRPSLFIVSFLVFLFGFSEMLYLTPFITLTITKICYGINIGSCDSEQVQKMVSSIGSTALLFSGIISTLMGGKWGQWSDQYGRVRVFAFMGLIRVIGNFLHLLTLTPLVPYNKWLIILSATLNSVSGGMFALFGNVNSYITDIVEPEDRISSISTVNSVMQVTTGVAPLIGAILVKIYNGNDAIPIYVAIFTGSLFTVLCFTMVVEPRHHKILEYTRSQFNDKQLQLQMELNHNLMTSSTLWFKIQYIGRHHFSQFASMLAPLKHLWLHDVPLRTRLNVLFLVAIDFLFLCAVTAILPSFLLFTTYKYHWTSVELGFFISISGISSGLFLFMESRYGIPHLKKVFQVAPKRVDHLDKVTIGTSMSFITLSVLIVLMFPDHPRFILFFVLLRSLGRICTPVTEATIMKHYSNTGKNSGQIFGAIALLNSLSMLVIPPILLQIYGSTVGTNPEYFLFFPLIFCLVTMACCFGLSTEDNIISMEFDGV